MTKQYKVAGFELYFPDDHQLENYQSTWKLYDRVLSVIVKFIADKYPKMTAIDIGANVGDSAALIQEFQTVPTLCIEGNPEYLEYLYENSKIIGNIQIADCFIGSDGTYVALDEIVSNGGTTSIVNAVVNDSNNIFVSKMGSIDSLLVDFPSFKDSKFLKIDTDGFDFDIIKNSQTFIKYSNPIIYFEYDITFSEDGCVKALSIIELLVDLGYNNFSVYDNFGNHIISLEAGDSKYFYDLTNYLLSSRYKSGQPVIYYFDICAFVEKDSDIFKIIHSEYTLIDLNKIIGRKS